MDEFRRAHRFNGWDHGEPGDHRQLRSQRARARLREATRREVEDELDQWCHAWQAEPPRAPTFNEATYAVLGFDW